MPAKAIVPVGAHLRVSGATPRGDGLGTRVHQRVCATSTHDPPLQKPREHHRKWPSKQGNRSNRGSRVRWNRGLRGSDPECGFLVPGVFEIGETRLYGASAEAGRQRCGDSVLAGS
jgi:hypothetical protein